MLNLPFVIQNVDNQLFLKAIFALAVYAFLVGSARLFDLCTTLIAEI
jgi:hypothetical protein